MGAAGPTAQTGLHQPYYSACQAKVGRHLPLLLSRRQVSADCPKQFRPLQARAGPHNLPTINDHAVRSDNDLVSGL